MPSGKLMAALMVVALAGMIGCAKSDKPGDNAAGSSGATGATGSKPASADAAGIQKTAPVDLSDKFASIKLDMTVEQVKQLMGQPKSTSGAGENATYTWEDAKASYVVGFQSGWPFTIQKQTKAGSS